MSTGGEKQFEGEHPEPGTAIPFHLGSAAAGDARVTVMDRGGRSLCETTLKATPGIHRVQWTLVTPILAAQAGRGGRGRAGGAGAAGAPRGDGAGAAAGPPAGGAQPQPGQGRGAAPDVTCSAAIGGRGDPPGGTAGPDTYVARLTVGGKEYVKPVTVLEDI